ncbi:MAG: HD domain-containing protein [Candidatus Sulfotelmatobacter sp.]
MASTQTTIKIPDTKLASEAHDILREYATDLLYNHSNRVYFFAAEQGRQQGLRFDSELLYVSAAFHDLGLLREYSSASERFEVDSANAAKAFLISHGIPAETAQTAWEAIALHTTPGVTQYMKPEVSLFFTGIGLDVLGNGFDRFPTELREQIVAEYPRENFNEGIAEAFFGGFAHKPASTWGTVMADVCERSIPGFESPNLCDLIAKSPFPNSASAKN